MTGHAGIVCRKIPVMRKRQADDTECMKTICFVALAFLAAGCGSNLTGTWSGPETGSQDGVPFDATLTATLRDNDGTLTGSWVSTTGTGGSISGTYDGTTANLAISTDGCTGDLTAAMTVNGSSMEGDVSGSIDCGGAITLTAVMTLTKQ